MNAKTMTHVVTAEFIVLTGATPLEPLQLEVPLLRLDSGDRILIEFPDGSRRIFTPTGTILTSSSKIILREQPLSIFNVVSEDDDHISVPTCLTMGG